MADIVLTPSQQAGYDKFKQFYANPKETIMLLKGYSGTGKSTLVKRLVEDLPKFAHMCRLLAPDWKEPAIVLSATTNQAAESLALATGNLWEVRTVHSVLGLRLNVDYKTGETNLIEYNDGIEDTLLFVDEASFVDQKLLVKIFTQTKNCKIVFIGDPCQMTPPKSNFMPVFELNNMTIELTDLVRFDAGPMTSLVGDLRELVKTNDWAKFKIARHSGVIDKVTQEQFDRAALKLFRDPDTYGQVKILCYTNDRVTHYNNLLSREILGTSAPQEGQRMLVNTAVKNNASQCSTNEEVTLESVVEAKEYGVEGFTIKLRNKGSEYFMPKHRQDKKAAHAKAVANDDYQWMKLIIDTWIDLRPSFACTVNKSQGSTYDIVLIDLGDICGKCFVGNQLARMLYVGSSRARSRVIYTGNARGVEKK